MESVSRAVGVTEDCRQSLPGQRAVAEDPALALDVGPTIGAHLFSAALYAECSRVGLLAILRGAEHCVEFGVGHEFPYLLSTPAGDRELCSPFHRSFP